MTKKTTDELLYDLMRELEGRASVPLSAPLRNLLILSTPRSGSTLFCDVLGRSGQVGECREWFNLRYVQAYGRMKGIPQVDLGSYVNFIAEKTVNGTGIFAINMHIEQHQQLLESKVDIFAQLNFDHVVLITRRDKVGQAVSLAKAWVTDQWSGDSAAKPGSIEDPDYSLIAQALNHILASEKYCAETLAARIHSTYEYEDFQQLDETQAFNQVLSKLGVQGSASTVTSMERQRDEKSVELKNNFLQYVQGAD